MIYLLLAILSSAAVSIFMRMSEAHRKNNVSMLAVNYVMCLIVTGAPILVRGMTPESGQGGMAIALGVVNGILYLASFLLLQMNTKENGVTLASTFMKLGVIVPTVCSVLLFHERPNALQVIGFVLTCGAVVMLQTEKGAGRLKNGAALLALLLVGGTADGMSKVFEQLGNASWADIFLLLTFGVALILCVGLAIYRGQGLCGQDLLWGLIIGVPNSLCARFLLRSLSEVPAMIAYPVFNVAVILLVSLLGAVLFRERIGKRQWIALGVILLAIVLLNM